MKHIDRSSRPPGSSSKLHSIDFEILREIIHEKCGIYFQNNKQHVLQSRVMTRLIALSIDYFEDYVEYVIDPANYSEFLRLIDAVTSTDTTFFRSEDQFSCIREQIIPSLLIQKKNKKEHTIRIWSAACATGEEAFSLAMIVDASRKQEHETINIEIIGSDINTRALYTGECGLYKAKSIEQIPYPFQKKYFSLTPSGYKIDDCLLDRVTFKRINLADRTDMMRMHGIDLVLCANVLHSFSHEAKQKTLQALYNCMNDEGYLLIGTTETLFGLAHPFLEINIAGIKVFQKCA